MSALLLIIRIAVGALFTYSGWAKLMAPMEEFRAAVTQYAFLPKPLVAPVVFLVPWFELIFGVFFVLGFMTRRSAMVLAGFLAAFIALLARSLLLGLSVKECGCFGAALTLAPNQAVVLDTALILCVLLVLRRGGERFSLDNWLTR